MHGHCSMTVLDPQAFAVSTLADSEGLAAALRILESCLAGSDNPLDLVVQDLCSVNNLFEFIISGVFFSHSLLVSDSFSSLAEWPRACVQNYRRLPNQSCAF